MGQSFLAAAGVTQILTELDITECARTYRPETALWAAYSAAQSVTR
jgi:hypothetical protein